MEKDEPRVGSCRESAPLNISLCRNQCNAEDPKRKKGGWKTMPYIIGNEMCSMVANIGLLYSMILYLVQHYHFKQVTAANILNALGGSGCLTPLIGGFLADTYLGRFWTILISSCLDVLGMLFLVISATVPSLRPAPCPADTHLPSHCEQASWEQLLFLYSAFFFTVLASGGLRPCAYAFGADQFSQNTVEERKSFQSFFNWYFFIIYVAVVLAATVVVYLQQAVGWGWGFGVPAIAMALSILVFILGSGSYKRVPPAGSPLKSLAKVVVAAVYKRSIPLPVDSRELHGSDCQHSYTIGRVLAHTDQFRFLDKAAIKLDGELSRDGKIIRQWRLCTVHQVEELKIIIRILPIWLSGMFHAIAVAQSSTFLILQAKTMNRRMGSSFLFPAGSIGVFSVLALVVCVPIYDRLVLPVARRLTGNDRGITFLQRIGFGYLLGTMAMLASGIVEAKRRSVARDSGLIDEPWKAVPMSVFWLAPQLCLMGLAEAFNGIGLTEFYYDQIPEGMRSSAGALGWSSAGIGIFVSSLLLTAVSEGTRSENGDWLDDNLNRGHLDYFYYLLGGMLGANLLIFSGCSRWYEYAGARDEEEGVVKTKESMAASSSTELDLKS